MPLISLRHVRYVNGFLIRFWLICTARWPIWLIHDRVIFDRRVVYFQLTSKFQYNILTPKRHRMDVRYLSLKTPHYNTGYSISNVPNAQFPVAQAPQQCSSDTMPCYRGKRWDTVDDDVDVDQGVPCSSGRWWPTGVDGDCSRSLWLAFAPTVISAAHLLSHPLSHPLSSSPPSLSSL